jgi:peptidoglycan/LPS O-acetylase OafA/YrhL
MTVHVAMFSGLLGTKALGTPRPPSNFLGAFFVSGLPSFIGVFFVLPAMYLYLPLARAIISGQPRPPQRNNFLRRLIRLLPAYYFMYLVVLLTLNRSAIDGIWYVLRPILLLQIYLPSPFVPKLMNGMEITWTIPTMVQWYVFLPLIAWASHKFAARGLTPKARAYRLMAPVPILIAIGLAWLFFVKARGWDNRIVFWWPQGFASTIGIGMALAIGMALTQVSPKDTPKIFRIAAARPNMFWLAALAVFLVNCARPFSVIGMDAIYSTSGLLVTYLMVALFGLFAVLPLIAPGGGNPLIHQVLALRPIVHLGRVSYGIYLWHFAVMHFYMQPGSILSGQTRPIRELYGQVPFWRLEIITFAGATLLATLSYYLLEQPIAAWFERHLRRREKASGSRGKATSLRAQVPGFSRSPDSAMPMEQAAATVSATAADRDAIRSNLLDLEHSFGKQLLSGAQLTGCTRTRWEATSVALSDLWELFSAYSTVVDEANRILIGGRSTTAAELATLTHLLTGPSIPVTVAPVPLARRHITDNGRLQLSIEAAVTRMNESFSGAAELVTTVETVWNEATAELEAIAAALQRARQLEPGGAEDARITAAQAELDRLLATLRTDPLALWQEGRLANADLDTLRASVAAATATE